MRKSGKRKIPDIFFIFLQKKIMKRKSCENEEKYWPKLSYNQKTNGFGDLKPFLSFHTHRILKPYIRQDFQTEPPKLKVLREISKEGPKYPINYCYLQPKHVKQINRLACENFWPGIDVTECLKYPDFSCVVTYKELIGNFKPIFIFDSEFLQA